MRSLRASVTRAIMTLYDSKAGIRLQPAGSEPYQTPRHGPLCLPEFLSKIGTHFLASSDKIQCIGRCISCFSALRLASELSSFVAASRECVSGFMSKNLDGQGDYIWKASVTKEIANGSSCLAMQERGSAP